MKLVEQLRGRSEYERSIGVSLIYMHHTDVENICKEIEQLNTHYDGTIMYGNRLVDLIEWAEKNGVVFPAKIYNPCVIAIEHFRNERERLAALT